MPPATCSHPLQSTRRGTAIAKSGEAAWAYGGCDSAVDGSLLHPYELCF
jgi:hypothetical protein